MKLEDRERIEGTDITIGRRVYYKAGAMVISPRWAAEYREGTGRQVCVNLGTQSKLAARRKALALHAKVEDGQPHVADARLGLEEVVDGVEQATIATLAYAGLRIGEAEQMLWRDVRLGDDGSGMFHVRLGGSNGTTKDKDARFVPIHSRVRPLIAALPKNDDHVFPEIRERQLLQRVKELCGELKFPKPTEFKLHSFRHHFASLCANHQVAYRKALSWLGHSDSSILQLYYHLSDSDSQAAMESLGAELKPGISAVEGNLRAIGQSTIENAPQDGSEQSLRELLGTVTERGGFEPP